MKLIFKLLALSSFIFCVESANASAIVKVFSAPCANKASAFQSTGIVVDHSGRKLILANSHAVLNGTVPEVCTWILDESGSEIAIPLLIWEWNLFAVLEAPADFNSFSQNDFALTEIKRGEKLNINGFAMGSSSRSEQANFEVIVSKSDRGASLNLFEIRSQSGVDGGFVGAPIFDSAGRIRGVVSNHFAAVDPGHPSVVAFFEASPKQKVSHVFAHPSWHLNSWIQFPTTYEFSRTWHSQWQKKKEILFHGFTFTEDCAVRGGKPKDTVPYPIGGVYPIGIGGSSQGVGCRIWVRRSSEASTNSYPALWWTELTNAFNAGIAEAEIVYVARNNPAIDVIDRQLIGSLEEITSAFSSSTQNVPVILTYRKSGGTPGFDPKLSELRNLASSIQVRIKNQFIKYADSSSEELNSLIREIYFISVAIQSEQWTEIEPVMIENLVGPNQFPASWKILGDSFFGDVALKSDISKLKSLLEQARK